MRGRVRLCAFAVVTAVIASSVEIAAAQTLQSFTIGHWRAGAYALNGRFSHCAAGANYGSGITVLFSIDRQYRWTMGLTHRNWRLTRGSEFDIAFSIDDGQPLHARGQAVHPTQANIPLAGSMELFDRFRRGFVLRIAAGSRVFSFNLDGTSAMLAQLHDCVRRYTQPANVATSSGRKRGAARVVRTTRETVSSNYIVQDPSLQAEATVLLANVMAAANVTGYSLGSPEEASKISVHAVWAAPSVVGTLLIIPERRVNDREIPGLVTGINAMGCKGAFMSGSLPSDGSRAVRVTTTCQPPNQPMTTSYYFGIPRPRGGLYLFTTTTTRDGGREDAERTDETIRQATYRTVN